ESCALPNVYTGGRSRETGVLVRADAANPVTWDLIPTICTFGGRSTPLTNSFLNWGEGAGRLARSAFNASKNLAGAHTRKCPQSTLPKPALMPNRIIARIDVPAFASRRRISAAVNSLGPFLARSMRRTLREGLLNPCP